MSGGNQRTAMVQTFRGHIQNPAAMVGGLPIRCTVYFDADCFVMKRVSQSYENSGTYSIPCSQLVVGSVTGNKITAWNRWTENQQNMEIFELDFSTSEFCNQVVLLYLMIKPRNPQDFTEYERLLIVNAMRPLIKYFEDLDKNKIQGGQNPRVAAPPQTLQKNFKSDLI